MSIKEKAEKLYDHTFRNIWQPPECHKTMVVNMMIKFLFKELKDIVANPNSNRECQLLPTSEVSLVRLILI